jgi:hypothetical protein
MGRCLEDVTKQQVYILAAATVTRREAVLLHHKSVLPTEASDWLRAQPLLTGESLFGTVAAKTKPLLQEHRDRLKDEAVISTNRRSRTFNHRQDNSLTPTDRSPFGVGLIRTSLRTGPDNSNSRVGVNLSSDRT